MKPILKYILAVCMIALLAACKKEINPTASNDLNIPQLFGPSANADPMIKEIYANYGIWIRMDFNNWKEVTNGILDKDANNWRYGVGKIDDNMRQSAIIYTDSLLANVSTKFTKSFFPLEFFFVKTYNGSWWAEDLKIIGRSRLVICWPNQMYDALPITDTLNHYYKDSTLARAIWTNIGSMIALRMENPIPDFELAGKPYDNGQALDKIFNDYYIDYDLEKRNASLDELGRTGGYISGTGSRSFDTDFPQWLSLIATESYENIKRDYLDNSERRAKKYEVIIDFFNDYGWDIQAAGNKYRKKLTP